MENEDNVRKFRLFCHLFHVWRYLTREIIITALTPLLYCIWQFSGGYGSQAIIELMEEEQRKIAVLGPVHSTILTFTGQIAPIYKVVEVRNFLKTGKTHKIFLSFYFLLSKPIFEEIFQMWTYCVKRCKVIFYFGRPLSMGLSLFVRRFFFLKITFILLK